MSQTLSTPTDAEQELVTKPAGQLQAGDWAFVVGHDGPVEVLSAHPDFGEVLLVLRSTYDRNLIPLRADAREALELCTADEITAAKRVSRRHDVATQMERLATVIRSNEVPLPGEYDAVTVTINVEQQAEVERVGTLLNIEPKTMYGQTSVAWPPNVEHGSPFRASWFAYVPRDPKPEPTPEPAAVADESGLAYSREADDPTPISPARVPLHTGSVVDGGQLVTDADPVTRYFSFGHGHTDPDTGEKLIDKYVTVVAPTAEECRTAMNTSRFGRAWSHEYIPGGPKAEKWIPLWTEHERIEVTADPTADAPVKSVPASRARSRR
jgi:hypothetical protein